MRISDTGIMELSGMEFHAFHGCLEQERLEGNRFVVDLKARYRLGKAAQSDDLADAYDYGRIYQIVAEQMQTPSMLLENVAARIVDAIVAEFAFEGLSVRVSKQNPPVGGACRWSSITASYGEQTDITTPVMP